MDWSEFPFPTTQKTQEAIVDEIRVNQVKCVVAQDQVELLDLLLTLLVENNPPWLTQEGPGLVHLATQAKALGSLKLLLRIEIPVDVVDENNLTTLHKAIADMWFLGVDELLKANADIQGAYGGREQTATEQQNSQMPGEIWIGQKTALQRAVECDSNGDSVQILQAIVNRAGPTFPQIINIAHMPARMNPLIFAVTQGKLEFVKILVRNGADVTLTNEHNENVLHIAIKKRFHRTIEFISREKSAKMSDLSKKRCNGIFEGTPLLLATYKKDFRSLKFLAKDVPASLFDTCDFKENSIERKKCTVLHLAALSGDKEIIDYFIPLLKGTLKRLVAAKTEKGDTPLKFAFEMQETKFAHALLTAGADLSTQSADGKTDMEALNYYHESPVKFMTEVLNKSFEKDKIKCSVLAKYTVLMPQNCCQAEGGHAQPVTNQPTAPAAPVTPETRTNGPNTTRIAPENAPSQNNNPGGPVVINMPTEQEDARNHFGVLKELKKMGEEEKEITILEHPLVESYLYLYWMKISGPYIVLLGLNFIFGVLLVIASAISIATYANSDDNDTAPLDRNEIHENTTADIQYGVHSDIWLKILVAIPMLLLSIYEVQCLSTRDRPLKYWLQSGLALFCFCATIWWLGTNQTTPFLIAFFMAWIQFAILILDLRQCHGFGSVVVHFIKTISGLKDVFFGFLISFATVIVWGGGPDFFILRFKGVDNSDVALNITLFSVIMLLCIICFVCFVLILAYSIITYNDTYKGKEKNELIVQQIQFLEIYEKYLFEKPLGFGDRGLIYYIYKGICLSLNHISEHCFKKRELTSWKEFEVVNREHHVYSSYCGCTGNQVRTDSGAAAGTAGQRKNQRNIFLKGLRDIFITERKNRENETAQLQAPSSINLGGQAPDEPACPPAATPGTPGHPSNASPPVATPGTPGHPSNEGNTETTPDTAGQRKYRRNILPYGLVRDIFITERKNRENETAQLQAPSCINPGGQAPDEPACTEVENVATVHVHRTRNVRLRWRRRDNPS